jgi:4-oxalocrotonate tautomerase
MPFVEVNMYEGRTPEQKKKLVEGITQAFVNIGTPAEAVQILLKEASRSNWAAAGKFASER